MNILAVLEVPFVAVCEMDSRFCKVEAGVYDAGKI
jgi:hypothetical protein